MAGGTSLGQGDYLPGRSLAPRSTSRPGAHVPGAGTTSAPRFVSYPRNQFATPEDFARRADKLVDGGARLRSTFTPTHVLRPLARDGRASGSARIDVRSVIFVLLAIQPRRSLASETTHVLAGTHTRKVLSAQTKFLWTGGQGVDVS